MDEKAISGSEIKDIINKITAEPGGFEVYVITKIEPYLKKVRFVEDGKNNLRYRIRDSILQSLKEKYGSEAAEYVSADKIADNQHKFYIIPITERYDPLAVLRTSAGKFCKDDINSATGIAYLIRTGGISVWVYQHAWSILIPNKTRKHKMGRLISSNHGDEFEELNDPTMTFTEKADLLVIKNNIITSDIKLLQNSFGFQDYIKIRADKVINTIQEKGIVKNIDKLVDYVQRGNGKTKYAKKMMRIADSKVLKMDPDTLWENIHSSNRWNGKIKEENGAFVLDSYTNVEELIDLLDERYTRSDITGEEYDTEVKQVAAPV